MNNTYKKIDFRYLDIGLVLTDIYGSSRSRLYMIYATSDNQIVGYILLNQKPELLAYNLLKLQISENIKNINKWVQNPISHNPIFTTSPYILYTLGSCVSIAKSRKHLHTLLKVGSDHFLDELLDIPSVYLSSPLSTWVFTPRLALHLIRDQIKRNRCLALEDV